MKREEKRKKTEKERILTYFWLKCKLVKPTMEISMGVLQEKFSLICTETIPSHHITSILAYQSQLYSQKLNVSNRGSDNYIYNYKQGIPFHHKEE